MIVQEIIEGRDLIKTYSNIGKPILQVETGAIYGEAIDIYPCPYTYEETDMPLDNEELEDGEAFEILMGGADD